MAEYLEKRLPFCVETGGHDVVLRVDAEPATWDAIVRLNATVLRADPRACVDYGGLRLRLSWRGAPKLSRGDRIRARVRLRAPWGMQNPGGFDFERWYLAERIHGGGYVQRGERLGGQASSPLRGIRQQILERISGLPLRYPEIAAALAVGHRSSLAADQWTLFADTGTVHLLVISGLHIGLAMGIGFAVGTRVGRIAPAVTRRWGGRPVGIALAWITGFGYAAVSGWGTPAVRALTMGSIALLGLALSRRIAWTRLAGTALLTVMVLRPATVHSSGFWFSFVAAASLLAYFAPRRLMGVGRTRSLVAAQLLLFLVVAPLSSLLVGRTSLVAPLANLFAVPLVSLVVVPGLLAASVASVTPGAGLLADGLYIGCDMLLHLLVAALERLHASPVLDRGWSRQWLTLCAVAGAVCVAHRPHAPWLRPLVVAACLLWVLPANQRIPLGEFRVTALDVGQGSAIVVDTRTHRLLFDAGARYPSGFDIGEAVVVPSLARSGPFSLDTFIVSHADTDHAGGAASIVRKVEPEITFGDGIDGAGPCEDRVWQRDEVRFELFDFSDAAESRNDRSCVLAVQSRNHTALFAGDISRRMEAALLARIPTPVTFMMVPHHGSVTSSGRAFVRRLAPRTAVVSAGRGNRYGHPHPDVVRRYCRVGANFFVTGLSGAVQWSSETPDQVKRWRVDEGRYWTNLDRRPSGDFFAGIELASCDLKR